MSYLKISFIKIPEQIAPTSATVNDKTPFTSCSRHRCRPTIYATIAGISEVLMPLFSRGFSPPSGAVPQGAQQLHSVVTATLCSSAGLTLLPTPGQQHLPQEHSIAPSPETLPPALVIAFLLSVLAPPTLIITNWVLVGCLYSDVPLTWESPRALAFVLGFYLLTAVPPMIFINTAGACALLVSSAVITAASVASPIGGVIAGYVLLFGYTGCVLFLCFCCLGLMSPPKPSARARFVRTGGGLAALYLCFFSFDALSPYLVFNFMTALPLWTLWLRLALTAAWFEANHRAWFSPRAFRLITPVYLVFILLLAGRDLLLAVATVAVLVVVPLCVMRGVTWYMLRTRTRTRTKAPTRTQLTTALVTSFLTIPALVTGCWASRCTLYAQFPPDCGAWHELSFALGICFLSITPALSFVASRFGRLVMFAVGIFGFFLYFFGNSTVVGCLFFISYGAALGVSLYWYWRGCSDRRKETLERARDAAELERRIEALVQQYSRIKQMEEECRRAASQLADIKKALGDLPPRK